LLAGAAGQAVVTVDRGGDLKLAGSSGNSLLDDAVMKAMRPNGFFNWSALVGEHRFTFAILRR
jgi:hypothetical protein